MRESAGYLVLCYEIRSGRTATRSISMEFKTVQDDTEGETIVLQYDTCVL